LTSDIEKIHHALETGKRSNGAAVTDADREIFAQRARGEEDIISEFRGMTLRGADVTFENSVRIRLGKRLVDVLHLGRGNTAGDAVVFVPDAKVLVTGDTVVAPVPYSFGSYPTEWVEVLRKLTAMDAVAIVPGHGPVMHDAQYLGRVAALLESMVAQVRAAYHPGATLEEVRKKVDLEKFRAEFAGDERSRKGMFQDSIVEAGVKRAFQEVQGKFAPEGED
jgi:glyoxylase-like metal-dependent hydrolase (beta-lactamase superfamily II)